MVRETTFTHYAVYTKHVRPYFTLFHTNWYDIHSSPTFTDET